MAVATFANPVLSRLNARLPGLLFSFGVAVACLLIGPRLGGVSPLLLAIIAGAACRNLVPVSAVLQPGLDYSAKTLLRAGVVLLGLQLSLPEILALGPGVLVIVACTVAGAFSATVFLGRLFGIDRELTRLIAAGFSICGAAAVAGMQGVVRASQEKVASAVAMVVLFGTLMIPGSVGLVALFGMSQGAAGTLIGGSVHEVAQVVAAAGIAGGHDLLSIAVPIKLARVVLLAPMIALVSLGSRRAAQAGGKRPPLMPLFVVGFLGAIAVTTLGWLPASALAACKVTQQFLLAAAMFALGMGVHVRSLIRLGWRPVLLSLLATAVVATIVGAGIIAGLGA